MSFLVGELSASQKPTIVKLIEKKDCLRKVIATMVNENEVPYVNNRFISKDSRIVSNVLEIFNSLDIEGLLMTVDIEKTFDSKNHSFLFFSFLKFEFEAFVQILLNVNLSLNQTLLTIWLYVRQTWMTQLILVNFL